MGPPGGNFRSALGYIGEIRHLTDNTEGIRQLAELRRDYTPRSPLAIRYSPTLQAIGENSLHNLTDQVRPLAPQLNIIFGQKKAPTTAAKQEKEEKKSFRPLLLLLGVKQSSFLPLCSSPN